MKYRFKHSEIDAFRWTGGPDQTEDPEWVCDAIRDGIITFSSPGTPEVAMLIATRRGTLLARQGDWVIRDHDGHIEARTPRYFEETFEPVEPQPEPAPFSPPICAKCFGSLIGGFCRKCERFASPDDKYWCARCGVWGDHQSGWCPHRAHIEPMKRLNIEKPTTEPSQ